MNKVVFILLLCIPSAAAWGTPLTGSDVLQPTDTCASASCNDRIVTSTPEPVTFALIGVGLVFLGFLRRRYSNLNP